MIDENVLKDSFLQAEITKKKNGKTEVIWPSDGIDNLKGNMTQFIREKLDKFNNVAWVNPLVQIIPYHPDSYVGRGEGRGWREELAHSLFLPVACHSPNGGDLESFQRELEKAYADVNRTPIDGHDHHDQHHLTAQLRSLSDYKGDYCFKCQGVNNDKALHVRIFPCDCLDSNPAEVGGFGCAEHYKELLGLVSNGKSTAPIWFVPHKTLCLSEAKSALHEQHFVGVYLVLYSSEDGSCLCDTKNDHTVLRDVLDDLSQLFYVKWSRDQHTALHTEWKKTWEENRKQVQMLRLLEEPLNRLSSALASTQEDAQWLRAVLYEPSNAMFSMAPQVMEYFEDGRKIKRGGVRWVAMHDPGREKDRRKLALSLSAIICEIFGRMESFPENEGALYDRAIACLKDADRRDSAFGELGGQVCRLLDCKYANGFENMLQKEDISDLQKALIRVKEALYRPFKEGESSYKLVPLLLVIEDSYSLNSIEYDFTTYDQPWDLALCELNAQGFPVPRYAQWLTLIHGVLAYAKAEKKTRLVAVRINKNDIRWEFKLEFEEVIFSDSKELFEEMARHFGMSSDLKFLGNFKRPYLQFAMVSDRREGRCFAHDDKFIIWHRVGSDSNLVKTTIKLKDNCLSYSITTRGGT